MIKQEQHELLTLWNFPREFPMPCMSSADTNAQAARDLINALENPSYVALYNTIGKYQTAALHHLAEIFRIVQPIPIPAPIMRVL